MAGAEGSPGGGRSNMRNLVSQVLIKNQRERLDSTDLVLLEEDPQKKFSTPRLRSSSAIIQRSGSSSSLFTDKELMYKRSASGAGGGRSALNTAQEKAWAEERTELQGQINVLNKEKEDMLRTIRVQRDALDKVEPFVREMSGSSGSIVSFMVEKLEVANGTVVELEYEKSYLSKVVSEQEDLLKQSDTSFITLLRTLHSVQEEVGDMKGRHANLSKRVQKLTDHGGSFVGGLLPVADIDDDDDADDDDDDPGVEAPTNGPATFVFTGIQNSAYMWEVDSEVMQQAVVMHNDCLRALAVKFSGYEVRCNGEAFLLAFSDAVLAVRFCLAAQEELLSLNWPEELSNLPTAATELGADRSVLFKGLRVRMGVHCGTPHHEEDPLTGRVMFFGPVTTRCAKIGAVALGGQVVVSLAAYECAGVAALAQEDGIEVKELGQVQLAGVESPTETLYQFTPSQLRERKFAVEAGSDDDTLMLARDRLATQLDAFRQENSDMAAQLASLQSNFSKLSAGATALLKKLETDSVSPEQVEGMMREIKDIIAEQAGQRKDYSSLTERQDKLSKKLVTIARELRKVSDDIPAVEELTNKVSKAVEEKQELTKRHDREMMRQNTIRLDLAKLLRRTGNRLLLMRNKAMSTQVRSLESAMEVIRLFADDLAKLQQNIELALSKRLDNVDSLYLGVGSRSNDAPPTTADGDDPDLPALPPHEGGDDAPAQQAMAWETPRERPGILPPVSARGQSTPLTTASLPTKPKTAPRPSPRTRVRT